MPSQRRPVSLAGPAILATLLAPTLLPVHAAPPARVEAQLLLARSHLQAGRFEAAEATLRRAQQAALESGDESGEAEALALLAETELLRSTPERTAGAKALLDEAAATLGQQHLGSGAEATLCEARSLLWLYRGDLASARRDLDRAATIRVETLGADHPRMVPLVTRMGAVAQAFAEHPAAIASFTEVLRLLGPDPEGTSESLGSTLYARGESLRALARYAEAGADYRGALAIARKTKEPGHPLVRLLEGRLAGCLEHTGGLTEAVTLQRSRVASARLEPVDPQRLGTALGDLARTLAAAGDREGAVEAYREVATLQAQVLGPNHPILADTWDLIAGLLTSLGRSDEAAAARLQSLRRQRRQ